MEAQNRKTRKMTEFKSRVELPEDLPPGDHAIRVQVVEADGTVVYEYAPPGRGDVVFGDVEVHGTRWHVTISRHDGRWTGQLAGSKNTRVHGSSLEQLMSEAKKITSRRRQVISVPFTTLSHSGKLRHGTIVGIHQGNGNKMVEWANGTREQWTDYRYSLVLPRLNREQAARITELQAAHVVANTAFEAYKNELVSGPDRRWRLDDQVTAAIEAAAKSGGTE